MGFSDFMQRKANERWARAVESAFWQAVRQRERLMGHGTAVDLMRLHGASWEVALHASRQLEPRNWLDYEHISGHLRNRLLTDLADVKGVSTSALAEALARSQEMKSLKEEKERAREEHAKVQEEYDKAEAEFGAESFELEQIEVRLNEAYMRYATLRDEYNAKVRGRSDL
ncbi:hypothetical protein GCM10009677_43560 [Sphaerisporangium rubeum]|uniref:Uncharacterized protein (DUF3084 family) n=1 Tax=Sphaerisporangium rubeum TaxID=321317 RepID=A0A7X0IKL9_9ACTN|nr:hypothetical protein [Sphaerisporangium rubeum]MBB6476469.1 uncharacterized protein (DUF3084 family) [Sphaerisporangium rubeum]